MPDLISDHPAFIEGFVKECRNRGLREHEAAACLEAVHLSDDLANNPAFADGFYGITKAAAPALGPWVLDGMRLAGQGAKHLFKGLGMGGGAVGKWMKNNPKKLVAAGGLAGMGYAGDKAVHRLRDWTDSYANSKDLEANGPFDLGMPDYVSQYLESGGAQQRGQAPGGTDNIFAPPSVFGSQATQLPGVNQKALGPAGGPISIPNPNLDALTKRRVELDEQINNMKGQLSGMQGSDLQSILQKERLQGALNSLQSERNTISRSVGGTVGRLQKDQLSMQNRSGQVMNSQTKILADRQAQADRLARLLSGQEERGWWESFWRPQTRGQQVEQGQRLLTEIERRKQLIRDAENVRNNVQLIDPAWEQ